MDVIEVLGLEKRYGDRAALAGVDLAVGPGEVVAVLGPNGAGKSTLLEILEGHRRRDGGAVRVLGEDPDRPHAAWRARLGIVLQEQGVVGDLTVAEVLELYGGYYPRRRPVGELLDLVGLADRAADRVEVLSGGACRRLDLALGLVGDPDLLFLDEPTTGFDPDARRRSWAVIDGIRASGTTVLLTTHYLEEATALADRVVVLAGGRVVAQGTPAELCALGGPPVVRFDLPPGLPAPQLPAGTRYHPGGAVEVDAPRLPEVLAELGAWALAVGHDLADLTVRPPSLEDVYLQLVEDLRAPELDLEVRS